MRGTPDLVERIKREYFARNLLDPASWIRKADELRDAAALLKSELDRKWARTRSDLAWAYGGGDPPLGLNGIWLMLKALEIENLCKARLVAFLSNEERAQIDTAGTLPRRLHSHDLPDLVRQTDLTFTDEEKGQLERLEDAAVSFGRYPLPTRSNRLFSEEVPSRQDYDLNDVVDADSRLTEEIARRLRGTLSTDATHR